MSSAIQATKKSTATGEQGLFDKQTLLDRFPIRAFKGPLTEKLVREPGNFGLGQVPKKMAPDSTSSVVCGYCSTGCSLKVHLKDGTPVNLTPDSDYPVNLGMACPKGWESLAPLAAPDRATTPLVRDARDGELKPVDWSDAADVFCKRMREVQEHHGPESVAFLSTGQICTEEMAFLGAFAKFGMGMIHGDGNTRQCMATAVTAYKESFGFDAPPYTYADFEESDVIVLVGSNLCIAHPIMWQRVLRNKRSPEIIVIDPRRTETAMQATKHVPLAPKSDLIFFYGIAHLLIRRGYVDHNFIQQHTAGYHDFTEFAAEFGPEVVSEKTGISVDELERIAELIGTKERVSFWWTMGVNQGYEATRTAQSIINLALMTGNIGRPGTGANSITGQCNAMGSRLFSNTTSLLGGRDFTNESHREKVADILDIPVSRIPDQRSMAYDEIIDGIESGKIKALWVVATNGAHSWTNRGRFKELMKKLDFLVVQDLYTTTETAQLADLVLPAAGWAEKDGTFINSERRIGLVKKLSPAPGQALADFSIFRLLANTWGCGDWIDRWSSPEAAFEILKDLSAGQPCDITGIGSYKRIDERGGTQWPVPESQSEKIQPERRLFEDGKFFTPDQRARFVYERPLPNPEPPDREYPMQLLTGRGSSAQWHTQTRTGKSAILRKLYPQNNYAEIYPADAEKLGIGNGDTVEVSSRRGTVRVMAFLTATVGQGRVFLPMHYAETNLLTNQVVDPYSRQPNYKACAVKLKKCRASL